MNNPGPATVPGSFQAAALSLCDWDKVRNDRKYHDRVTFTNTEHAHDDIVSFGSALVKEGRKRGWPLFCHRYFRGRYEQDRAFALKRSKARFGQSPHNYGLAVDIIHHGRLWALTEQEWSVLGALGKEVARRKNLKITWGGDWSFWDPAHWELADWKDMRDDLLSEPVTFSDAFRRARDERVDKFLWRGQWYTTELA